MSDKAQAEHKAHKVAPADDLPKRPIGQTILVILLIAAVVIIFGIGPSSLNLALGGSQIREIAENVDSVDVARYQRVEALLLALQQDKNPYELTDEEWGDHSRMLSQYYAYGLKVRPESALITAQYAEQDGMKPSGAALDALVEDFLDGQAGTLRQAIHAMQQANVSGRNFTGNELRSYIATQEANQNYQNRYTSAPVAIDSMGDVFGKQTAERVYTQEARIDTSVIIEEFKLLVAADQDIMTATYEEHKALKRFEVPRQAHVTVFGADASVIAASVVVSEEAIAAWYNEHKETDSNLRIENTVDAQAPATADAAEVEVVVAAPITYKTLEASKSYVRNTLESEISLQIVNELCETLALTVQESDVLENFLLIEGKEEALRTLAQGITIPATDERLSRAVGIRVWQDVTANDAGLGVSIALNDHNGQVIARMSQAGPLYIFAGKHGQVSLPQVAENNPRLQLMIVMHVIDATYDKELAAVQDDVITLAAVEKAYPALIERVVALRDALSTQADSDLSVFFATAEQAHWAALVTEKDYAALDDIETVQDEETLPIMAYTQAGKGYIVATATSSSETMKAVRIVHVLRHEIPVTENADTVADARTQRAAYVRAINAIAAQEFNKELQAQYQQ